MFSLSFTLVPAVVPDDPEKKPVEEAEDEQGKKKENVGVGIDHSDTVDFIRSNNHTIAQAHDISCVCMHPLCIGFRFCAYLVILQSISFHSSIIVLIESATATEGVRFGF